ncbi:MAG: MBG domain-containing protein [Ekhidna sp.]
MKTIENQFIQKLSLLIFLFTALCAGAFAQFEPALNFDGSAISTYDYIEVPDANSLDITNAFTFETWVRFDNVTNGAGAADDFQGVFYKSTFNGNYGLAYSRSGVLRFYHIGFGASITDYSWAPVVDTWYHVAVTFNGTKSAIIVDGTEVASQTDVASSLTPNTEPLVIGASPFTGASTWPFEGSMEEIRMWNIAKTASEINTSKDTELKGDESGLVLYYHFNEGTIGGDNTSISFVRDRSLQGNNGTLNGFVLTGSTGNFVSSADLSLATPFTDQTITFGALANRTFGDADFTLSVTGGSSGNPVTFSSSDETVATVSVSTVTVLDAGNTNITAFQDGVGTTRHAEATQSLTVDPFTTSIALNLPATNPKFNGMPQGISPTANDIDGNPTLAILTEYSPTGAGTFSTTAPTNPGVYDVRANLDTEPNYSASEVTGTLTIESAVGLDIADTLKIQVEAGKMLVYNLDIVNSESTSLAWSLALSDTLGYGYETAFSKANFASWQLSQNQDRITDNVYITRGDNKSIFNARTETTSSNSISPADTEWSRSSANAASSFDPFVTMHGGNPGSLVGDTATVHLITDDQYHEVVFSTFSGGNSGGGFSYTRTPMHDYMAISGVASGNISAQSFGSSQITFDATNLKSGLNYGMMTLTTDDPANPTMMVVTEVEVLPAAVFSLSETTVGDTVAIADAATTMTFKIQNTGASELTWSTTTSGRPNFMNLVTLDAFSGTVPAGGEATITVTFDAAVHGFYEWPVTFTTNDPGNPNPTMTISMLATGVPFAVVGSPGVAFDDTFVGYQSSQQLSFNNTGTDTLFVYNAAVDQPGISLAVDSLTILPNSGLQSLELVFEPTIAGVVNGNLTFDTNDPTKLSNSLPFMGTALDPPVIDVSPASITQTLTVNDTVATQVTISNTGGSDLTWTVVASLPDAPVFVEGVPVNFVSGGLNLSDNISANVNLTRTAIGVATNDFYNTVEYPTFSEVRDESSTLRWSPKSTSLSSSADYINNFATVKNSLGEAFIGSTISLHSVVDGRYFDIEILTYEAPSGPFANFSYNRTEVFPGVGTTVLSGTTGAGGNSQFDVEFYGGGLTTGTLDGSYTITSNDPLAPSLVLPISLTVTGGEANMATTSATATAVDTQVNQTSDFSLEIKNTGNAPLNVSDVTVNDPAFGIGMTSFTVPAKSTYTLPLSFAPTLVQTYNATLSVTSDDPANSPFDVSLTGNGVAAPDFQVTSTLIQDTLSVGVTNAKMVSVINNSTGDLTWNIAGDVFFEKDDYADPSSEIAQDRISDFVWLTRGDNKPTYNYLENTSYDPDHTSILFGDGTTFSQPTYGTFNATFNGSADGQVGNTTSLYLVAEDRYFDLAYSKWTSNDNGGGFAYTRREAVPWLELGSFSGAVAGIGQEDVTATFKTNGLAAGDYEFTYDVATNDPANPLETVTFQLHVTGTPDINVTFASDSVRFGDVIIGLTTTLPVTINNAGDSTLTVSDIAFDNMAFGIDQTNFKVEPGKNIVLNVSFTPTMVATYKAGFTITSDDPDESPIEFGVRGSGIDGPNLDLNVMTINLQSVAGGVASADLTLSNSGQQSVNWNVDSKYISGSEVTFTRSSGADWTLPENQDRIAGNVWITREDSGPLFNAFTNNNNFISWAENKTVLGGALPSYDPDISNEFGGGSSMSSIPGNTMSLQLPEVNRFFDVYFNSWANGGGGSGSGGGFSYTRNEVATWLSSSEIAGSIAVSGADQIVTISTDAANLSAGTYSANLVLASTGVEPEQTVVVNLTVLGAPQIAITQSALDFGGVIENTEETLELEIANNGNSTLNISDFTIDNPTFSISNSPLAIEAGATALVPVIFSPSLVQPYTGTLTITNDDATNSSVTIDLSGAGISPPTASVDVTELSESLFFGASSEQTFTIQNTGSSDLEWNLAADPTATAFVNPNSDAVTFSIESGVIVSGQSQQVIVSFNPNGNFTGSFELPLQVVSNDPVNTRIDIPLSLVIGGITINTSIADQLEQEGFVSSQFDITGMFTDAQGDALTYIVTSSDESVVTVSELSEMVTVSEAGGTGTAMISITADDGKGTTETFDFDFRVNATPTIASAIGNQAYENAFGTANFDLSTVFSDADASDVLTHTTVTNASGIVSTSISNGMLTLTEQGPGTVNVTLTADDGSGGQVSDVFEVFVNKINQTITFNGLTDVTYGDAAFDPGATASSNLTVSYSSSNTDVATTSGTTITIVGAGTATITASQDGDASYNAALDVQQQLMVNQAALTATADDQSKTYGEANPSFTIGYSGFVNGDDASVLDAAPSANSIADVGSNVGTYAITASGGSDINYAITHVDGTLTITQAALTVTANDQSKTYGEANPSFTIGYSGFVNGDDASVLDAEPSASSVADAASDAGMYAIAASGGSDINYAITHVDGTLTVTQASLTATADDQSKTYGETNPSFTIGYSGFVNGDDASILDAVPLVSSIAGVGSNVGTYAITASGGSGINYAITHVDGTLTVTQASLTATAGDQSKTYGEANPSFTIGYSGFVNGDDASTLDAAPSASSVADATSNVGTYAIVGSGGSDINYAITHVDGTLTITQASLTATADDQTINEGDALPTFTISYAGFVNGEDASVLDTAPSANTSIVDSSIPGVYDITVSGGTDNNYDFSYLNGALTIHEVLGLIKNSDIKIYPNPVTDYLMISNAKAAKIVLFDLGGKQILSKGISGKVDLTNLRKGSYLIQLRDQENALIYSGRIIKN